VDEGGEEYFLDDVVHVPPPAQEPVDQARDPRLVQRDQLIEGTGLAPRQALGKGIARGGGCRGSIRLASGVDQCCPSDHVPPRRASGFQEV
jgi:hypothetical protein